MFLVPETPSYETIAERLGMKVGSIGPTRARCFEKLQRILEEMGTFGGEEA
jgi:DNA-directed RNA polymerase specialized sigma24 family protein